MEYHKLPGRELTSDQNRQIKCNTGQMLYPLSELQEILSVMPVFQALQCYVPQILGKLSL